MYRLVYVIALILILAAAVHSGAESLWPVCGMSMYQDQKAHQVGDLVTIIITEQATSTMAASNDYDKKFTHANSAGMGPFLNVLPKASFDSAQKGSSAGTNTMSSSLDTKLTATVTAVGPNGNLEVKATRCVVTNAERQEITLTGVVRAADVGTDNTVLSTFLSDVRIDYKGKGPIGNRQKEGIISKLLRFVF